MAGSSPDPARDNESRVTEIIVILSVTCTLSTLAVLLRIYSRAIVLRSFGADDFMIVPAQILTIASAVAIGLEAKYGLGRHVWMMPPENFVPYMKSFYTSIVVYNVAVCLTKISILLMYYRLFSNTVLRPIIFVGLGFLGSWAVTLSILLPMVCMPVHKFWEPDAPGVCLNQLAIWYVMAGINVFTDFSLLIMPMPLIKSLNLPARQKALLFAIFTLGIFPCAVSIYRIRTLGAAAVATDPTWDNVDAATFSFLELSVGVVTVCLPTLRPFLARVMPGVFGHLLQQSSGGHRSGPGGYGTGATGRGSRNPRRGASGVSASSLSGARSPVLKSKILSESDSTEELRSAASMGSHHLRSIGENDIEFGAIDPRLERKGKPGLVYSVSVVGGPSSPGGRPRSDSAGIKATTTVTQQITFSVEQTEKTQY
ncbi:hypothetical protein VTJ83DRAFT_3826 [Remersonia thermophila]|uniref:Rhodopsin domain-containing protein n=1 Tax=Remersonia thermophila TaxID=72144 RepID=A0ABR4DFQ0_9PEZI